MNRTNKFILLGLLLSLILVMSVVMFYRPKTTYQPYTDKTPTPFINGYPQELK